MVCLEEADYLSRELIEALVMPLTRYSGTAILGVSTYRATPGPFQKLIECGQLHSYKISYICDECLASGFKGLSGACRHRAHRVPEYINSDSALERAFTISCGGGDKQDEVTLREAMGVLLQRTGNNSVFSPESIERLFSSPRVPVHSLKYLFVSIDPASGTDDVNKKATSDFTCVAVGVDVILRVLAIPAIRHHEFERELLVFLQELRKALSFSNSILVFDLEGNGSMVWSYISSFIRQNFNNVLFMTDYKRKTEATNTDPRLKERCAKYTRSLLESGKLKIWEGFYLQGGVDINEFRRQMLDYQAIHNSTRSQSGKTSVTYSGKTKGKDDITFTLQRALYRQYLFFSEGG